MWFLTRRTSRPPAPHPAAARFRPRLEAMEDRAVPAHVDLAVTSLADSGAGTLRAAILTADAGNPSDKFTIDFRVTGRIDLQTPLPGLDDAISIQGPGADRLTVERAAGATFDSAVLTVDAGRTAKISGLTVSRGDAGGIDNEGTLTLTDAAVSNNSSAPSFGAGGGIFNDGALTIIRSVVSGNTTDTDGGGIFNAGTLSISGSTLSGNSAGNVGGGIVTFGAATVTNSTLSDNVGGGIVNADPGTLVVSGCTVSRNTKNGGIVNSGTAMVRASIVSGNSTTGFNGGGGGLSNFGDMTVSGCLVSGNSATDSTDNGFTFPGVGGGVFNAGVLTVSDSLVVGNSAGSEGGGIFNDATGTLTVRDSVVWLNSAPLGRDLFNAGTVHVNGSVIGDRTDA